MGRLILAGLVCVLSSYCYGQKATDNESQFRPASEVTVDEQSRFRNLIDIGALIPFFNEGQSKVHLYKPPVLTRGSRGVALFRQASPAIVMIVVGRMRNNKFERYGIGTGVVIDPRGYIITNWESIVGYDRVLVFFKPRDKAEPGEEPAFVAEVVGIGAVKDLALLRLLSPPENLVTLSVTSSAAPDVADDLHLIGHPSGNSWSYSTGVVSQIRQDYSWTNVGGARHKAKVLQMQTAINPNNSGGSVLNDAGQILGLVAMSEDDQNPHYAVAADEIRDFLNTALPPQTRGGTPPPHDRKQSILNYWESIDGVKGRVLKSENEDIQVLTYGDGKEWTATIYRKKTLERYTVRPSKRANTWQLQLSENRKIEIKIQAAGISEFQEVRVPQ